MYFLMRLATSLLGLLLMGLAGCGEGHNSSDLNSGSLLAVGPDLFVFEGVGDTLVRIRQCNKVEPIESRDDIRNICPSTPGDSYPHYKVDELRDLLLSAVIDGRSSIGLSESKQKEVEGAQKVVQRYEDFVAAFSEDKLGLENLSDVRKAELADARELLELELEDIRNNLARFVEVLASDEEHLSVIATQVDKLREDQWMGELMIGLATGQIGVPIMVVEPVQNCTLRFRGALEGARAFKHRYYDTYGTGYAHFRYPESAADLKSWNSHLEFEKIKEVSLTRLGETVTLKDSSFGFLELRESPECLERFDWRPIEKTFYAYGRGGGRGSYYKASVLKEIGTYLTDGTRVTMWASWAGANRLVGGVKKFERLEFSGKLIAEPLIPEE